MQDYLPLITGSGGCLVALVIAVWAFATGKIHSDREFQKQADENIALRAENTQLRAALETERKTVNETASAGTVTNRLIEAVVTLASAERKAVPPGLTAKDIGL